MLVPFSRGYQLRITRTRFFNVWRVIYAGETIGWMKAIPTCGYAVKAKFSGKQSIHDLRHRALKWLCETETIARTGG